MRTRLFTLLLLWFLVDLYFFQGIEVVMSGPDVTGRLVVNWGYWLFEVLLLTATMVFSVKGRANPTWALNWLAGGIILSVAPKLLVTPLFLLEDVGRMVVAGFHWVSNHFGANRLHPVALMPPRIPMVSEFALMLAAALFVAILYGMVRGKYAYRVHRLQLWFDDLPEAFNGFTITQLSDIHSGSFDSEKSVARGIEIVNKQKSDLLLFTGDLVNNKALEMERWVPAFTKLEATYGKFSILGNHDYGDYAPWPSHEAKVGNLERLKEIHEEIGFRLLLNENVEIEKEGQHIALVGVENWGLRGFHQYGDLEGALEGVDVDAFKILMSHDPSHWEAQVVQHKKNIHLTLSGHTHGMQFGIELPGFRWSPIQYIYKQWAGMYERNGRKLYVNRGFGFLAFPGRVGIRPEITVIELRRGTEGGSRN